MLGKIRQAFRSTSEVPCSADQEGRVLVNYIWINKEKAQTDFNKPACAIELANIKRALMNANKYPEADFNIWVDNKLLDDYSRLTLDCYIEQFSRQNNVLLRNLQEIPDYAGDYCFIPLKPTSKKSLTDSFTELLGRNVFYRADYARILVLDHCLKSEPERNRIIYSDIDCRDIRLEEVLPLMKKYGIAINDLRASLVSHGYIGMATDRPDIRKHFKTLKSETHAAAHNDDIGFESFDRFLAALNMPNESWHNIIGLPKLLPPMHTAPSAIYYNPPADKLETWKSGHAADIAQATAAPRHKPQPPAPQRR